MTQSAFVDSGGTSTQSAGEGVLALVQWLKTPAPHSAADDLSPLLRQLGELRNLELAEPQYLSLLEQLNERAQVALNKLRPLLIAVSLPISSKSRLLVRALQQLTHSLAEEYIHLLRHHASIAGGRGSAEYHTIAQRILSILGQHLLISNLSATQPERGVWQQLHSTANACISPTEGNLPTAEGGASPWTTYYAATLLGCTQPASFTAEEVHFAAGYLEALAGEVEAIKDSPPPPAAFWIDPESDTPATAYSRRPPPPGAKVRCFNCAKVASLIKKHLEALESGKPARQLNLADFADSSAGRGVLKRLLANLSAPGARRFPRRRQSYRANLCMGLENIWRLLDDNERSNTETSTWMITNESPDGYSVMHVSGKTGRISVGDVVALRTESGERWQVCIARWALSENQEHLELGLQILATCATPAILVSPGNINGRERMPVLLLPEIEALRPTQMLVAASGAIKEHSAKLVLVVEDDNIEIREVKGARPGEQNSHIEVFEIAPDESDG